MLTKILAVAALVIGSAHLAQADTIKNVVLGAAMLQHCFGVPMRKV